MHISDFVKSQNNHGLLMACIAATAWGTYGTFSTILCSYGMREETVSIVSAFFLTILFTILSLSTGGIKNLRVPKKAIGFLIIDGICSAIYTYSAVQAYANLSMGIVATIIYSNLFVLIFASRLIFKESITKQKVISVFVALFGVLLVVNVFGEKSGNINAIGLIWAFVAMLSWAGLIITEKLVMDRGVTPDASCAYEGLFALVIIGAVSSPVAAIANVANVISATNGMAILPILGFGFISTMTAYYFYMHALNIIDATYVQICYTLDPAVSCLLGFIIFGQFLTAGQIAGIIIVLATVIWIQIVEQRRAKAENS